MNLDGRIALVTGGSRGIGRAIALRLAESGADVAVAYGHDRGPAEEVADLIRGLGRRAAVVGGDLSNPDDVRAVADAAERALGPVDILVSNAAISQQKGLAEITVEDWDRMMNVNVRPAFLLAQRLTPGMCERAWGRVVLISSVAAFTGGIVGPHYAASKAALHGLMHFLARSLAPYGVTANVVAPTFIEGGATLPGSGDEAALRALARTLPVQRLGKPEEIADAVLAVVTNGYITAQTISVDGGMYPR